jgi:hypothetical protein
MSAADAGASFGAGVERDNTSLLFASLLFAGIVICFVPRILRPRAARCMDHDDTLSSLPAELAGLRSKRDS